MYIVFYTLHRTHSLYLVVFYRPQQVYLLLLLPAELHTAPRWLCEVSVTTALISADLMRFYFLPYYFKILIDNEYCVNILCQITVTGKVSVVKIS